MTKFALLFFITQCYLHTSSAAVYFTMTNVHMNLPLDSSNFNLGISLGKIYATSDLLTTSNKIEAKSSEKELLFAVVNTSAFIDISEYNGKLYLLKEVFKEKMKDQNHTVAISANVGSSISITPFTLNLNKANNTQQQHKAADKIRGVDSKGLLRLPADCHKFVNDLCFWPSVTYRVYENENGTVLGSLSPTYFHEECKNFTVKYKIKDPSNFIILPPEDGESVWRLAVHAPLNRDATHTEHYQFNHKQRARVFGDILDLPVTCLVEIGKSGGSNGNKGGKRYNVTKRLEIRVLDRNDNAPMAQYNDIKIYLDDNRVKEGQELHHNKLLFIDRDSQEVNTYDIQILNDTDELFVPQCTPYAVDHHISNHTALHCKLVCRQSTQMPTSPYTIIIQINDTSLLNGLNAFHVQLPVQIISDSSMDQATVSSKALKIYPKQFVEIYRSAAPFARLSQPKSIPVGVGHFRLMNSNNNVKNTFDDGSNHEGCFNVTPNSGIIFVHNVALLKIASNMRLNIQWINGSNLVDHDELTIHVVSEPTPTCTNISANPILNISEMVDNWNFCSNFESFKECEKACGLSTGGYASIENIKKRHGPSRCQWRGEKSPGEETTPHYATCTPDLNTCPDGVCDELEDLHHLICPQDCTRTRVISTIPNDNKRGIKIAAGICKCDDFDNCYCNIMDKKKKTTVKSDSRTLVNHSKTSPGVSVLSYNSLNRHTDHQPPSFCGTSCIIGLTAATIFIVLALTGAVLCWKLGLNMTKVVRRRRSSKYSDDVPDLLSAQLSDYVDRNNGPSPAAQQGTMVEQQMFMNGQHLGIGVTFDMGNGVTGVMVGSRLIPPPDPKWEFPRNQLIIEQTLGEGEFGRVLRAKANDIAGHPGCTTVAVKTLKDDARDAELADLMSEYELLKGVCHPNVIRLLGASTLPGGPIYLIMEFAEFGSLRSYIRRTRHLKSESHIPVSDRLNAPNLEHYDQPKPQPQQEIITSKDILSFAWQISKGMAYLTDIKLVHRDLAARNILVASGKICKISDFGLTRDVYEDDAYFKRSKGRVPVKWMAPESLSNHIYTTKSDIWSFGVLIWELVTLGATPYPGIPVQNLFHVLKNGYRMERPENCSIAIYGIMLQCWESDPDQRPTFIELSLQWEAMLEQDIEYLDLTPDAIHNRSYFCTLLSDDNNEKESTTVLNPAFSSSTQARPQPQTDISKILNNEEQLNLDKNQHSNIKHGESSKLLTTSSSIEDKSNNNNNNNTINKKSNTYSNTPNVNINSLMHHQHPNNITAEEGDALMADGNKMGEGYESPIKVKQKSPGNRTPTNEHPQYYTDMTVGCNGSGDSKQLLLPRGIGNSIGDLINTN